jgi:adenylate cyclase
MWDTHFATGIVTGTGLEELAGGDLDLGRVERLLVHLLRRQLAAAICRRASIHQRPDGATHAVGFADLVGFTALSQRLPTGDLSRLIVDFERAAHDITTTAGGWIVKTIGDEVMFAATDPMSAAAIALGLAGDMPDELPPLRVAVAWGPVLAREGDCFGPTVNRAARLVSAAQPGQALVDDHLRDLLVDPFRTTPAGVADVKDLGRVELWGLAAP